MIRKRGDFERPERMIESGGERIRIILPRCTLEIIEESRPGRTGIYQCRVTGKTEKEESTKRERDDARRTRETPEGEEPKKTIGQSSKRVPKL